MPGRTDNRSKQARVLDTLLEFAASDVPTSEAELDVALRDEGIDANAAVVRMKAKYAKETWRMGPPIPSVRAARRSRPATATRGAMVKQLKQASLHFRNADDVSDDDLWDMLVEAGEDGSFDDE